MILIGFSGKKKSGKTAAAVHLSNLQPNRVHILSFADALKDEVATACGVTRDFIEQNKDDFRLILQGWGTNFRRKHCGDDYWIRKFLSRAIDISKQNTNAIVLVPDVRFKNEANVIYQVGGTIIRIERPNLPADTHISETDLDDYLFNYVVQNDSTLETFCDRITDTFHRIKNTN